MDGICASFILWHCIRAFGGDVSAMLPERMTDGYGINERLVRCAASDGVDTIITCDNGIAAAQPLRTAGELGLTVIVTDHHEVPYTSTTLSVRAAGERSRTSFLYDYDSFFASAVSCTLSGSGEEKKAPGTRSLSAICCLSPAWLLSATSCR